MGFFDRIFGKKPPEEAAQVTTPAAVQQVAQQQSIPAERVGPDGQYDESGLAKRVALAFDQDAGLTDLERLWVAQTGSTVVLKGEVPSQDLLNKAIGLASGTAGATGVNTDEIKVG